jgi:hypothetical protein
MLDDTERSRTSEELQANLALTGLTPEQAAADLGLTSARFQACSTSTAHDPADVGCCGTTSSARCRTSVVDRLPSRCSPKRR